MGETELFLRKQDEIYRSLSEQQNEHYAAMHPQRDISWKHRTLTTQELLDVLRRNHLALGRDDSPYWQAEQKIRELLQTMDMIAALCARCGHDNDVCISEIERLSTAAGTT